MKPLKSRRSFSSLHPSLLPKILKNYVVLKIQFLETINSGADVRNNQFSLLTGSTTRLPAKSYLQTERNNCSHGTSS